MPAWAKWFKFINFSFQLFSIFIFILYQNVSRLIFNYFWLSAHLYLRRVKYFKLVLDAYFIIFVFSWLVFDESLYFRIFLDLCDWFVSPIKVNVTCKENVGCAQRAEALKVFCSIECFFIVLYSFGVLYFCIVLYSLI